MELKLESNQKRLNCSEVSAVFFKRICHHYTFQLGVLLAVY